MIKPVDHQAPAAGLSGLGRNAVNFVLFQVVWFVTVLGAARGLTWPGLVALGVFAGVQAALTARPKNDFLLVGISVVIGFLLDSALVRSGLLVVVTHWPGGGIAPVWMLVLWANLALAINHCLGWIHGRYWLAAGFGAIGGPLAYFGGASLGAGSFGDNPVGMMLALGICWAAVTPLLFWIAAAFNRRCAV